MSVISSFEIIKVVVAEPSIFFCIPASPADAPAVNPNGINTLLANALITFLLMVIQSLIMDQESWQEIHQTELF